MDTAPVQVFIKNEQGQVWGPLSLSTVELLLDNGIVKGKVMVSSDGVKYALPGRFPEMRDYFPRELWGVDAPGREATPEPEAPMVEMDLGQQDRGPSSTRPTAPAGVPMAGPGTAAFTAGPGARAAAQARPQGRTASGNRPGPPGPPVITSSGPVAARPAPPPPAPAPAPAPAKKAPAPAPVAPPEEGVAPPPSSGDLSEVSAVKLYSLAAGAEMTALLTFQLPDRDIQLHLRKGSPEYVASTHPDDSLGAFVLKTGLATPQQVAQAESQLDRFDGELLGALFGTGALNPGTAFSQLIERGKGLLVRAFLATSGHFTVEPKELPPQRSMPLGHKWAVLSELVRRVPPPELKRRLQEAWELPAMKSGGRIQATELRLTPQEARAVGHVDGVRSLAQFQKDMPQEFDAVLRVVFLLNELDGISFAKVPIRPTITPEAPPPPPPPAARPGSASGPKPATSSGSGPRPPPGRPPTAPRPAVVPPKISPQTPVASPAAAPAPPPSDNLEHLRALAARLKGQNHFEALELNEKADTGLVKVAYFKLAKLYHPDTVPEGAPPEIGQLKAEIFARVGEAYRTLSDDKLRADYLEELKHGGKGEQVDVAQILQAEEMFQKGCILVKARKWPDAVRMLDEAIKANPEEPEFYAWRGYAKFFATPDRKAGHGEALKDLSLALKKNDRIAAAHYFVGHIAKLTGDEKMALKEFKRAVELNPDHIDAAREVRMMTGGGKK
ncbi:MAG TPA: DnaJ domain-containing protein [Myxococcales bacterium]|nr:DnaJ domain-containing protein [Myxococcales bacterium]